MTSTEDAIMQENSLPGTTTATASSGVVAPLSGEQAPDTNQIHQNNQGEEFASSTHLSATRSLKKPCTTTSTCLSYGLC